MVHSIKLYKIHCLKGLQRDLSGSQRFGSNATEVVFAPGQYQPNFGKSPVGSKSEAIRRIAQYKYGGDTNSAAQEYERLEQSLSNPANIISAQNHIGGATDFRGFAPNTQYRPGDPYRGDPNNPNGQANFFVQESRSVQVATATLDRLGIGSGAFTGISDGVYDSSAGGGGGAVCVASAGGGLGGPIVQGDGKTTGNFANPLAGSDAIQTDYFSHSHPERGGRPHLGVDLAATGSPPIGAVDGGTVDLVGFDPNGYGHFVVVGHGNGLGTLYGHLDRVDVVQGQKVSRGQNLGPQGSTGRSSGPHLHFEVYEGYVQGNPHSGRPVDPAPYLGNYY